MAGKRAWEAALAEHEAVLAEALAQIDGVPVERWLVPKAEGKWSPAEEALHVTMAYELGLAAASGGTAMQLRVSPALARLFRWTMLPFFIAARSFPRGAVAPRELRPPREEAHALTPPDASARLRRAAGEAARALRALDGVRPKVRVVHACFGPLRPLPTLRLLSAHTRHHARSLALLGTPGA